MRKVINISVPEKIYKAVERDSKREGFASKSEYIRSLLRERSEDRAVAEVKASQREARSGKLKELKSFRNLQ